MRIFMDILFLIIIFYFIFSFSQLLMKMKGNIMFPASNEHRSAIRKHPQKPLDAPTYAGQKVGIIMYSVILLIVIIMFSLALFFNIFNWTVYLLLFLPMANAYNLLNLFGIVEDGILSGSRFVPWKNMKSFYFVRIDGNHKYYGYSKETNDTFELKINTRGFPISCVVTTDEMKEKLTRILNEYIAVKGKESV